MCVISIDITHIYAYNEGNMTTTSMTNNTYCEIYTNEDRSIVSNIKINEYSLTFAEKSFIKYISKSLCLKRKKYTVDIEIGSFCDIFDIKDSEHENILNTVYSLLEKKIQIMTGNSSLSVINLVEKIEILPDSIIMIFNSDFCDLYFGKNNVMKESVTRHINMPDIENKYTKRLYHYIYENKGKSTWVETIENLKNNIFNVPADYYNDFRFFNRDILVKSIKDLNDKSGDILSVNYLRQGRKVYAVEFKIEQK